MFFSSTRVPNFWVPLRRTLTFASQRNEPSSRLPSLIPRYMSESRSAFKYSLASSALRSSGSPTISTSGTPLRFRSTCDPAAPCTFFPASSSRWMRVRGTLRTLPSGCGTGTAPPLQMGSSYWEIWYPLGRSG